MWRPPLTQQVNLRLENARASEQLLAIAQASELNIFADATHFSTTSPPVSLEAENSARDWILETASVERLSWRQTGERTFLFWKEPDVPSVAKSLVAELKTSQPELALLGTPEDKKSESLRIINNGWNRRIEQEAGLVLADHLQEQRGWDGQSPLQAEFKLSELPPETAAKLLGIAQSNLDRLTEGKQRRLIQDTDWFSDESWRSARVLYSKPRFLPQPLLAVRIKDSKGLVFSRLEGRSINFPPSSQKPEKVSAAMQNAKETLAEVKADALANDASLASLVTLQVKAATLDELLSAMKEQSGIAFQISPNIDATQRVTAYASALPLHQVMDALSNLYGVSWTKTPDGSYLMQTALSPARIGVLQVGDTAWFQYWRSDGVRNAAPPRLTLDQPVDWQNELLKAGINEAALRTPDGVALSSLPKELQTLIRQAIEEAQAVEIIRQYNDGFAPSAIGENQEAITVRVSPAPPQAPVRVGAATRTNNSLALQATLVKAGKEIYGFSVYGPKERLAIAESIAQTRERQANFQQRLEEMQNDPKVN